MSSFQRTIPSFTSNTYLSVSADNSQHSSSHAVSVSRHELLLSSTCSEYRSPAAYPRNGTAPLFVQQPIMNHFQWSESNYDAPIHVHH